MTARKVHGTLMSTG